MLHDAPEPMSPKTIAEALNKNPGAVRYLLYKMTRAGEIVGVGGAYSLPITPPYTANTVDVLPVTTGKHDG